MRSLFIAICMLIISFMGVGIWRTTPGPRSRRLHLGMLVFWIAPLLYAVMAYFPGARTMWLLIVAASMSAVGYFAHWVARGEKSAPKEDVTA